MFIFALCTSYFPLPTILNLNTTSMSDDLQLSWLACGEELFAKEPERGDQRQGSCFPNSPRPREGTANSASLLRSVILLPRKRLRCQSGSPLSCPPAAFRRRRCTHCNLPTSPQRTLANSLRRKTAATRPATTSQETLTFIFRAIANHALQTCCPGCPGQSSRPSPSPASATDTMLTSSPIPPWKRQRRTRNPWAAEEELTQAAIP